MQQHKAVIETAWRRIRKPSRATIAKLMKSSTLPIYKRWLADATPEQITTVDAIYALCERNYEAGGHWLVETVEPAQVLEFASTPSAAREFCLMHNEQATNCRWGEDSDPEVNVPAWKD